MRYVQILLALTGMVLLLRYGVVRVPGFGEATMYQPAHWEWHTLPAVVGIVCVVVAMALVVVRNE